MLRLQIYNHTKNRIDDKIFSDLLDSSKMALVMDKRVKVADNFLIELNIVGTQKIISINKKFRNKNKSTDVISLSFLSEEEHDFFAGEIFICLPFARKQAQKMNHSLVEELRFLFVHGLLHLFGYDHLKSSDEKRMVKMTLKILGNI